MSAELLRRAAALMRERAEDATAGPWSAANEHELLGPNAEPAWCVSNMRPGYQQMSEAEGYLGDVAETSLGAPLSCDQPNAEHIASWHPAVALAVADWLDAVAGESETDTDNPRVASFFALGDTAPEVAAIAVARTYLGEES